MRGPNLSPALFLLHLDDQSQVKRKGAGEGHTEPMSRSSWRQQPANQHQLVKKPTDETHNNKQDSVQFKKQKTKHNVKCIFFNKCVFNSVCLDEQQLSVASRSVCHTAAC